MKNIPDRAPLPLRKSRQLEKSLKEAQLRISSPPTKRQYRKLLELVEKEEEILRYYRTKIKEVKTTYFPLYRKQSKRLERLHFIFRAVSVALFPPWTTNKNKGG